MRLQNGTDTDGSELRLGCISEDYKQTKLRDEEEAQQRASSVSRDERADRRAAQAEVEAAAARAAAAVEAACEVAKGALTLVATLMTGTDGDLVATSANVRVSTGRTPRIGNDGGGDGDDDDGVVMVSMMNPDTGTEGQGDGDQGAAQAPGLAAAGTGSS
ncbi:hypothetical protein PF001_g10246 [Phytophthora fragariae]|uniref:Uncharacterized protein n=2 Tax=Phytophthora fragariae TaxID=53985 RepID=A0A6A3RNB0_9STRA|nr:hypothetical protein PF009_g6898 [Phytophthora fragariae]KAE9100224.1 hypothetical protein PF006_g22946 [Phytophthora fragariae]KAE9310320.1 hypothetical protein PF001_g10246 [Phytophthora fragariae]